MVWSRPCPQCGKSINRAALACKYCAWVGAPDQASSATGAMTSAHSPLFEAFQFFLLILILLAFPLFLGVTVSTVYASKRCGEAGVKIALFLMFLAFLAVALSEAAIRHIAANYVVNIVTYYELNADPAFIAGVVQFYAFQIAFCLTQWVLLAAVLHLLPRIRESPRAA